MLRTALRARGRPLHRLPLPYSQSTPPRFLHVRSVSVFSGVAKLAGRTASRSLLGVGIGFGGLTWADMKVDGFKTNAVEKLSSISATLGSAYSTMADTTASTLSLLSSSASALSESAAESFADASLSLEERLTKLRERIRDAFASVGGDGEGEEWEEPKHEKKKPEPSPTLNPIIPALAIPFTLHPNDEDDKSFSASTNGDLPPEGGNDLLNLTRKLIEIRSMLLAIGEDSSLQLPSIVVIGSQSSGKSSVLEAIVGREFLPKGDNMVTRRPIELTLVHTPPTTSNPNPPTYAEFPSTSSEPPEKITSFTQVQSRLLSLNLSVPAEECVSPIPIPLRVYSPTVPDLTLIDLPGYVQLSSLDQPPELKEKIKGLCEKYIRGPNIILAVCAADVDLANSPALRAAREVDPLGMRTVGVVTKMDLVEPEVGVGVLGDGRYPLALGYVGVICKAGGGGAKGGDEGAMILSIKDKEEKYFRQEASHYGRKGISTGTEVLKKRLMKVLEESMSSSLYGISNAVQIELEEARYRFKVEYNDRQISAESYVAETVDLLKKKIGEMSLGLGKKQVRELVKDQLDQTVLDLLAGIYWADSRTRELGTSGLVKGFGGKTEEEENAERIVWERKLEAVTSGLTKSGVGRTSTQLVVEAIRSRLANIGSQEPLIHHPSATSSVLNTADQILRSRYTLTSDQVENAVKPFKFEVEIEPHEWEQGRLRSVELMQKELGMCEEALKNVRELVGGRKLRGAVEWVAEGEERERRRRERIRKGEEVEAEEEDPLRTTFPPAVLNKAREAMFLQARSSILRLRLQALKARRCKTGEDQKAYCPEAFLNVVADKLAHTAVQFINIELLAEWFYQFPREIDTRLSYDKDRDTILRFARENPTVAQHLALQERKEKLELVAEKLDTLVKLQRDRAGPTMNDTKRSRFTFF